MFPANLTKRNKMYGFLFTSLDEEVFFLPEMMPALKGKNATPSLEAIASD